MIFWKTSSTLRGIQSHNCTANFCGGTERPPPHSTQRVNVCVRIRRSYVSLHQWFCTFFPHYFITFIIVLVVLAVGAVAGWLAHELAHAVSYPISQNLVICPKDSQKGQKRNIIYSLSHKHGSFSSNRLIVPIRHWENITVNFYRKTISVCFWKFVFFVSVFVRFSFLIN